MRTGFGRVHVRSDWMAYGWGAVGAICERASGDVLDPDRLSGLVDIGVDEISWKKHHNYLTPVSDHATGRLSGVKRKAGKDTEDLECVFR